MTLQVPDLACQELVELVTDYLEERLATGDRVRFELHLTLCDGCRTYLRQMRRVRATAGRLDEASLAPETRDALLEAFRGWKRGAGGSEP
jgi:anti-sigma factor RsiW